MPSSFLAWSVLVLATGLAPFQEPKEKNKKRDQGKQDQPPAVQLEEGDTVLKPGGWDPFFDYTHLPPANEAYWEPLSKAAVELEQALSVAAEAVGAPIWLKKGELQTLEGQPAWHLELFTGGGESDKPKRVNFFVSTTEPKVLRRVDLLALAPDELAAWTMLAKADTQAEAAMAVCKLRSQGEKAEPTVANPRMRRVQFVPTGGTPLWKCELMGIEKEVARRYGYEVNAEKARIKQRLLLDRFPGEPLRREQPVELPNGMFLHDFIVGDGPAVSADSKVKVHYRLFLLDNTKLHDTWKFEQPETFLVSQAPLKGMTEGMVGMRVGGKRKIAMPFELAFGERGNEIAPPKAMVVCDVAIQELISE